MDLNLKTATLLQLADELIKQRGAFFTVDQHTAHRNVASIRAELDRRDREAAKPANALGVEEG